jgi:hypothetical protein
MCSNTSQDRSDEDYTFDNSNEHYTSLNDTSLNDTGSESNSNVGGGGGNDSINYTDRTTKNYRNNFYDFESKDKDKISQKSQKSENALSRQLFLTTSVLFLISSGSTLYMINNYNNHTRIVNNDIRTSYFQYAMIVGHSCISSYSLYMLYKGN